MFCLFLIYEHLSQFLFQEAPYQKYRRTRQLFTQVNQFFAAKDAAPLFDVNLIGIDIETPLSGGRFIAKADLLIGDVHKTDLIIIPAIDGEIGQAIEQNKAFLPWIIDRHHEGAEVASLCLGAFLLASTGLLNGKKCATHWMAENQFRKMFPEVHLVTQKIITDEHGIYSQQMVLSVT